MESFICNPFKGTRSTWSLNLQPTLRLLLELEPGGAELGNDTPLLASRKHGIMTLRRRLELPSPAGVEGRWEPWNVHMTVRGVGRKDRKRRLVCGVDASLRKKNRFIDAHLAGPTLMFA